MSLSQMISFMAVEEKAIEMKQKLPKLGQALAQQQYVMTPILAETTNASLAAQQTCSVYLGQTTTNLIQTE